MRGIRKAFGACVANDGVDLEVEKGEIHAIVGENGAGKSTLMKLAAGVDRPDGGTLEIEGRDVTGWSASEAIAAGVGMVHQHFMLVPTLTVAENVVLGSEPTKGARFDLEAAMAAVDKLSKVTGLDVPVDRLVGELAVGIQQRVEILKTLYRGARIIILDEPTAVLSPPEVRELFTVLRTLRDGGATIVLITHKLREVMEISKTITVMHKGKTVTRLRTSETSPAAIARAMVGRDVRLDGEENPPEPREVTGEVVLEVRDLVVATSGRPRAVDRVSFEVKAGEILGIAGVEGNGQTELIEAIAGIRRNASGGIRLGGVDIGGLSVRERTGKGLAHVPEDRQRRGLVLDFTIAENLVLGRLGEFSRYGFLDQQRVHANAEEKIRGLDIRPPDPSAITSALSGGNQQKIVIARELSRSFRVLLAAQPTRGVDVGAIELIHDLLRKVRDEGKAILLVSAELQEILALSDRIAVLYRGRIVATMPRSEASSEILGAHMAGIGAKDEAAA